MADGGVACGEGGKESELHLKVLEAINENRQVQRRNARRWRAKEVGFWGWEKFWHGVDSKRRYTDERVRHMTVIAETSALIAGFQMIMFYELPQPSLTEYEFSSVLLAVWGVLCLAVACANLCVLFAAMIIAVNMLDASAHETIGGATSPQGRKGPFSPENPDGFIDDVQGMEILWQVRHEKQYIQLLNLFAISAPFFIINVGITTFVKFYVSSASAWLGLALAIFSVVLWWKFHSPAMEHLKWPSMHRSS
eukprot:761911-Hanusia_phi.AAC.4